MNVEEVRKLLFSDLKSESKSKASLFLDQSETHTFSDWLAVSLWGVGVDNPQELYVGVFPDLSDFLERDGGRFRVHAETLKAIHQNSSTAMKAVVSPLVKGRWFIDLGAGKPHRSIVPRLVAQLLGAKAYIGVDINYSGDSLRKNEFIQFGHFDSYFLKNDWVELLKNLKTPEPVFIYAAGVELSSPQSAEAQQAKAEVLEILKQSLKPGDHLLLGAGTTDFDWKDFPFKKLYSDHYHFLHRRKGKWPWSDWFH